MEVKIYTKTNCPFCDLAKSWFGANNIPFTQITLDDDEKRAKFYNDVNKNILLIEEHVRTVPQIFVGDVHIGGYDNLMARAGEVIARVKGSSLTTFSKTFPRKFIVQIMEKTISSNVSIQHAKFPSSVLLFNAFNSTIMRKR